MIKTSYGVDKNILIAPELAMTYGVRVGNANVSTVGGKKKLYPGAPLVGDLENRNTAFVLAATAGKVAGVYTAQLTTAFAAEDEVVINGVTYTCGATESKANKVFAVGSGDTAAVLLAQITSIKNIVEDPNFTLTAAIATITFTQKVATAGLAPTVAVAEGATGVFGDVTQATAPNEGTSNANAVLIQEVDVTEGDANGAVVTNGSIDMLKLDDATLAYYDLATKSALTRYVNLVRGSK